VRDAVLALLVGDEGRHRYRPTASSTHYAECRVMPRTRVNRLSGMGLWAIGSA
jgi:hypothetical protein